MKTNPKRIPRTEADCRKAYDKGLLDGSVGALTIMLYVMKDKYGYSEDQLHKFADQFNYVADSMAQGYVTKADLMQVVKEEYGTVLRLT